MEDKYSNKQATDNYSRWKSCQSYLDSKGLKALIPKCVNFKEGNQWARVTEGTKHIPRPVINFTDMIIENKASNILGTPVHLNFRADNNEQSTVKFTNFASYQLKEMEMDYYDYLACYDGLIKGTYVYYFYFDANAIGQKGDMEGALRCEVIDPLNIGVSNPMQTDIQKQKWIIVKTREDVESVKALCDNKVNAESIAPDNFDSNYTEDKEQENSNLVTVYTRFFKVDNEVYFEKSTQYVDIHKPIPLNPNLTEKKLKMKEESDKCNLKDVEMYEVDPETATNSENTEELTSYEDSEFEENQIKFSRYPFEMGTLKPRNHCIYGKSEVEDLMEAQMAVNFQLSMILMNSQQLGWGKVLVKKDALHGQKVTNKPGQVLVDHTPLGNWGIKQMEGQQFSNGSFELINQVINMSRSVTNSSDVVTGDMISKDLSGTAIAQLQAQAQKPIEQMQRRFWRSKERIGKILELYYKLYYEGKKYSYEITPDEYSRREEELRAKAKEVGFTKTLPPISRTNADVFSGTEYSDTSFHIIVEAGTGTQYSQIMQMDLANSLILNGNINKLSSEDLMLLITMYPDSAMPHKSEIIRFIRNRENSEINSLKSQLQEASNLLMQAQKELQARGAQIDALNIYNKELEKQFEQEYKAVSAQNKQMTDFMINTPYQGK